MNYLPPYRISRMRLLSLHFHPDHWKDLEDSGLREKTIESAGVYSLAPGRIRAFFSRAGARKLLPLVSSALCFPYQGGEFARIKLFPSIGKMKYAQPPGTSARLYMPFPVGPGLIIICEGEKKTLAAHATGMNAVGIGGVWNWVRKGEPIDDLSLIEWQGREVEIVPDSDVWERRDLMRAIYALGTELAERGAIIDLVKIPGIKSVKIGLDDYLLLKARLDYTGLERVGLGTLRKDYQRWYARWKISKIYQQ